MSNTSKPHIRFNYSEELWKKTTTVLDQIEQSEDPTPYRGALSKLIVELTEAGLRYYYIKPLELAKVGFLTEKSAILGVTAMRKVIDPIIHRIVGGMNKDQLQIVCGYLRQQMY